MANLLLLSSSKTPANPVWMDYAKPHLETFVAEQGLAGQTAVFVPYAAVTISSAKYTDMLRPVVERLGMHLTSVHEVDDPVEAICQASVVLVGGGNTYTLNHLLHEHKLHTAIARHVAQDGIPYIGWSAGANVAFTSIVTTNDMNGIGTTHFKGFGFVPCQLFLNPHFKDAFRWEDLSGDDRAVLEALGTRYPRLGAVLNARGESQADRLMEHLEQRSRGRVLGLREGGILRVRGQSMQLIGEAGMTVFSTSADEPPTEYAPGADVSFLLNPLQ